jgi:hypothetical protein
MKLLSRKTALWVLLVLLAVLLTRESSVTRRGRARRRAVSKQEKKQVNMRCIKHLSVV